MCVAGGGEGCSREVDAGGEAEPGLPESTCRMCEAEPRLEALSMDGFKRFNAGCRTPTTGLAGLARSRPEEHRNQGKSSLCLGPRPSDGAIGACFDRSTRYDSVHAN